MLVCTGRNILLHLRRQTPRFPVTKSPHLFRVAPIVAPVWRSFHTSRITFSGDDLYAVLGVPRTATPDEIKNTYYKYAKQLHPDLPANKGNEEARKRFAAISAAYDVLGDEKKRKKYDTYGHQAMGIEEEDLIGQINSAFSMGNDELADITQGTNVEVPMNLTFEEAARGATRNIEYKVNVVCEPCTGSGASKGSSAKQCTLCAGKGYTSSGTGIFHSKKSCSACGSYGTIIAAPCNTCKGTGTVQKTRKLVVKIPAGVDNDFQMKVLDKGNVGPRGSNKTGHLYLLIQVQPHPVFKREKYDIHVDVPITVSQAILGDTVQVRSLDGLVEVKVPAGVQPGEKRVLKGRGVDNRGHQYIHFQVVIPKNLTKDRLDLIRQFGKDEITKPNAKEYTSQYTQTIDTIKKLFNFKKES